MTAGSSRGEDEGLLAELEWRGILHAATSGLAERLAGGRPIAGYNGFDPSGASLHVGHLVPIFGLLRFQRHGGRPVVLVGGGTGMIGDPSGRSSERNLLDRDTLEANVASLRIQLERFLDFSPGSGGAVLVNNLDWLGELSLIEFLRDTGKHFTIPYMLAKDSVQTRLERGLSFTEFSYMLLQAYDYWHLHRTMGVELQMGGADQWGNITAGLELIRRTAGGSSSGSAAEEPRAHALAYKLLLSPSGTKFGKSESGESVWLDPHRTTPYAFYQYWLNTDDRDIGTYLRWFTELGREEIEVLDEEVATRPEARAAQRRLADDITARTHGVDVARQAREDGESMFASQVPSGDVLRRVWAAVDHFEYVPPTGGGTVGHIGVASGSYGSNTEVRRAIQQGSFWINELRATAFEQPLPEPIDGEFYLLRTGKRRKRVGRLAP